MTFFLLKFLMSTVIVLVLCIALDSLMTPNAQEPTYKTLEVTTKGVLGGLCAFTFMVLVSVIWS